MYEEMNTCPICGYDAKYTTLRNNHHDVFQCSSRYCGVLFEETGLGSELLSTEFEEGEIYCIMVWSDAAGDIPIEMEVVSRYEHEMVCIINDVAQLSLTIMEDSGVEYVTLEDLGFEDCIYAYTME